MADEEQHRTTAEDVVVTVRSAERARSTYGWSRSTRRSPSAAAARSSPPAASPAPRTDALFLMGLEHSADLGLSAERPADHEADPGRALHPRLGGRAGRIRHVPRCRTPKGDEHHRPRVRRHHPGRVRRDGPQPERRARRSPAPVGRISRITRAALTGAALTYRPAYGELGDGSCHSLARRKPKWRKRPPRPRGLYPGGQERARGADVRRVHAFAGRPHGAGWRPSKRSAARTSSLPATRAAEDKIIPTWASGRTSSVRDCSGEIVPSQEMRSLDDVITTDNLGVVPPAYLTEDHRRHRRESSVPLHDPPPRPPQLGHVDHRPEDQPASGSRHPVA